MKTLNIKGENSEYQIIDALKNNRSKRAGRGEIFIEGIESIKQAFESGLEITRIITTGKVSNWAGNILRKYENAGTCIIEMDEILYGRLCEKSEPSEMLVTARMPKRELYDTSLPEKPFILVLDRPSDAGNLGSVIRSANSFGVDSVLIIGHGVDPWEPKTIRASLGSVFFTVPVQIESMQKFGEYADFVKDKYCADVLGTDSGGDCSLDSERIKRPVMLVLGNEAKGMSVALKNLCDKIIGIPVSGNVNSLNLASAASIFMWEIFRNSR